MPVDLRGCNLMISITFWAWATLAPTLETDNNLLLFDLSTSLSIHGAIIICQTHSDPSTCPVLCYVWSAFWSWKIAFSCSPGNRSVKFCLCLSTNSVHKQFRPSLASSDSHALAQQSFYPLFSSFHFFFSAYLVIAFPLLSFTSHLIVSKMNLLAGLTYPCRLDTQNEA